MKKTIIGVGLLAALGAIGIAASRNATDQDVIDSVVDHMTESDLAPVVNTKGSNIPDLTPEVVAAIVDDLKDIEGHNGFTAIAFTHHVSTAQVKQILKSIQHRRNSLHPVSGDTVGHP